MNEFKLLPFQEDDIRKLYRQPNASIESEMAAGKTHEGIALEELWNPLRDEPTLIIAPINTWDTWRDKYDLQSPGTVVTTIDRKDRDEFIEYLRHAYGDVFLMHYEAVDLMPELQKIRFGLVICDEAHRLSNQSTKQTIAVKGLTTRHKLAMSGTMTGDTPDKLWSVYNWLWPTVYSSYWHFRGTYCRQEMVLNETTGTYYKKIVGVKNIAHLNRQRDPWRVRHLKREQCCTNHPSGIMDWLPDKTYDVIKVDLSPTQRKFYNQMRDKMIAWIGEHETEPLAAQVVIAQLTRLSQMALATPEFYDAYRWTPFLDHYGNKIVNPYTEMVEKYRERYDAITLKMPSSKIEAVKEYVKDHSHEPLVVFSSSKKVCYLLDNELKKAKITSEVLSGDTPQNQRNGMVKRFNNNEFQVFTGVIEAAAEGIDGLQQTADTMLFLDRSWRTIKNKQAEERLDRPGQKNSTHVIDVIARDTIDAGKNQDLDLKWGRIKAMLGDPK